MRKPVCALLLKTLLAVVALEPGWKMDLALFPDQTITMIPFLSRMPKSLAGDSEPSTYGIATCFF